MHMQVLRENKHKENRYIQIAELSLPVGVGLEGAAKNNG